MDHRPPLVEAVNRIGDRWTILIVASLLDGPQRFGELSGSVDGIAPNVLTKRIRQLEFDGVIRSTAYSERPPRFSYALTDDGRQLAGALALLSTWGSRHMGSSPSAQHPAARHAGQHSLCGATLETRLWCPTCDRSVDPDSDGELVHL